MKKALWISVGVLASISGLATYLHKPSVQQIEQPQQVSSPQSQEKVNPVASAATLVKPTAPQRAEYKQEITPQPTVSVGKPSVAPAPQMASQTNTKPAPIVTEEEQRLPAPPYLEPGLRVEGNLGGPPLMPDFGLMPSPDKTGQEIR